VVDDLADRNLARFALWFRGARALFDGRAAEAEEIAEQCLALSVELDDPDGIGVYGGQLGVIRWMQGRLLEMEPMFEQQRGRTPPSRSGRPCWPTRGPPTTAPTQPVARWPTWATPPRCPMGCTGC
jgi:hypothetical protein